MKKVKNYIDSELAKKKVARYRYWSIKDEQGITISTSEEEGKSFSEVLDKIVSDNVDAEVQIKYGTNEQSSRNNPPLFIQINEKIEWVEPEEEVVKINGVPHKPDRNGNVNIQFPEIKTEKAEYIGTFKQEVEMQLEGLKREYQLKEEKWQMDLHNKMMEQTLKFREMMLKEKEDRLSEREQQILQKEAELTDKEENVRDDVKGYLKQIPSALGGLIKDFIKESKDKKEKPLGEAKPKKRSKVKFSITPEPNSEEETEETTEEEETDEDFEAMVEEEIKKHEAEDVTEENIQEETTP